MNSDTERIPSRDVRTRSGEKACVTGESVGKSEGGTARVAGKVALFLLILVFLNYGMGWVAQRIAFQLWPRHANMALTLLTASVVAYMFLLAIPFLPGIEIGLMVMVLLGRPGIVLVYLATVLALTLSFLLGRLLSPRIIVRALDWFHLDRARNLVSALAPLGPEERLRFLLQSVPSRSVPFLLRHRYLVIAVLFNLPGNALIGGGGGIGLVAGMSRLFFYPKYLFAVCLAITPVPILFLLRGA
ncbi:MAG: hypothetical protein ACXW4J_09490 [Candidatus Deferrimicrobiaceae bacterium]